MKAIGYTDDLPLWRRFQLAVHDVGPRYIRDLKTEGYDKLTLDQVQRAKTHGVTIDYIRGIKAEGYKTATLEALVRTRDHGVTQQYIKAMKAEGFTGSALEDFVRTRDHGVTQAYIQGMKKAGFTSATIEELVRAPDHGVSPEYVQEIRGLGLTATTLEEFIRLRDHGVRAAFVTDLKSGRLRQADSRRIWSACTTTASPAPYVRDLSAQGFKNVPLEPTSMRAKDHGVSAEFMADMKQLGLKDLTLDRDRAAARPRHHARIRQPRPGARLIRRPIPEELIRLKNGGLCK